MEVEGDGSTPTSTGGVPGVNLVLLFLKEE